MLIRLNNVESGETNNVRPGEGWGRVEVALPFKSRSNQNTFFSLKDVTNTEYFLSMTKCHFIFASDDYFPA